jgi:hypothetical protein
VEGKSNPQIAAAIREWSIAELIDAGEAIKGIEDNPGFQVLARVFGICRESALNTLVDHPASENVGNINKQLGRAEGLGALPDVLATVREKAKLARAARQAAVERADAERQEA